MQLAALNIPFYNHKEFFSNKDSEKKIGKGMKARKDGTIARQIFNSLSHPEAVTLLIEDYENLPFSVRLEFNTIAQKENGNPSNSVSKGLTKANTALKGKILRAEKEIERSAVFNQRVETANGVEYRKRQMSKAAIKAAQKYGKII